MTDSEFMENTELSRSTESSRGIGASGRPLTILRTGAGSLPSPPVIDGLRRLGCRVIAADADPLSVGFFSADEFAVIPRADAPGFRAEILSLCESRKVDMILPAVNEELEQLNGFRNELSERGVSLVAPPAETLEACLDKQATAQALARIGLCGPRTVPAEEVPPDLQPPWIGKPRRGRGSRGVTRLEDGAALDFYRGRLVEPCVIQELLPGEEYTCDLLADRDGELRMATVRKRLKVSAGISVAGEIVSVDPFRASLELLTRELPLPGPSCVQFFWTEGEEPRFTDLNPRLGGGVALAIAAGVPLLEGILALVAGEPIPSSFNAGVGMRFLRRYEEVYLDPCDSL